MKNSPSALTNKQTKHKHKQAAIFIWAAATAALLHAETAYAYIDPGSGSAIITAILGAIGAVGYTFRKYYYKIKNLFRKNADKDKK